MFLEAQLDDAVTQAIEADKMVGLSLSMVVDGEIGLCKQYGLASREEGLPVTAESRFCVASVSKQFTAACILLLQEEGMLSVDDRVGCYFPELTDGDKITIRDLLNHVSGYPDYYPADFISSRLIRDTTPEEVLATYGTLPPELEGRVLNVSMFRSPDGKIAQYLF